MSHEPVALALPSSLSREFLLHHRLCPRQRKETGEIVVALAPDAIRNALQEVAIAYGAKVIEEETTAEELDRLIERITNASDHFQLSSVADPDDVTADVRDLANQQPVVRYVNLVVRDAHDIAASDIHLEATATGLSVRFRLDGVLVPAPAPPAQLHHAVISRIKLLAQLDIAERRRPQDGRIRVQLENRQLDLRVSTVPTVFGESVVLRLLDRGGRPVALEELGMPSNLLAITERLSARPHGLVLVTGPTGSGKTTTLYAALVRRDTGSQKIITVEDPVEYQLAGVTQVPVHRGSGVTFGSVLRSILRQDPDVVMVGEMRDTETAEIAVQAAMTGHLVFSTMHTNDALGTIPRLLDLGIPDYLVGATLDGVIAQRLVRRNCSNCVQRYQPSADSVALLARDATPDLGRHSLMRGAGCSDCRGTGYRGRTGLFELLTVTDPIRDAIARRASRSQLQAIAASEGMRSLRDDGWTKVQAGLTTVEEVLRVVSE